MTRKSPRVWRFVALFSAWLMAAALVPIAASAQDGGQEPPPDTDSTEHPLDEGVGVDIGEEGPALTPHDHDAPSSLNCTISDGSEWSHCVGVDASLDQVPDVGGSATLTVTVSASDSFDATDVEVTGTPGVIDVVGGASADKGAIAPGDDIVLTYTVNAVGTGPATITANALVDTGGGNTDGSGDSVFVTVAGAGGGSSFGIASDAANGTAVSSDDQSPAPAGAPDEGETPPIETVVIDDDTYAAGGNTATSCVTGRWGHNPPGADPYVGVRSVLVQVWDDDTLSGDDLMGSQYTSGTGFYNICFPGADGFGEGPGALEIYVRFIHDSNRWRIRDTVAGNNTYINSTTTLSLPDGGTQNRGNLQPGNSAWFPMLRGYDQLDNFWNWVVAAPEHIDPDNCFDPDDATCREMTFNWTPTSTTGAFYSLGNNSVSLKAGDIDAYFVLIHEATHALMDDVFNDDYPAFPNCNPHFVQSVSSTGCAWTEGFAEYIPAVFMNESVYRFASGAVINLETPTWGTSGWGNGDAVEGRVAGAMIDVHDSTNEASWDKWSESDYEQFETFLDWDSIGAGTPPDTFSMFWTDRAQDGLNTSNSGARASLYQNTIDYTYRNPLGAYASQNIKGPNPGPHNYSISNSSTGSFWSVVGVSDGASNYNLNYWDLSNLTGLQDSSSDTNEIDFVTMDFNHAAKGTDYPSVVDVSGSSNYEIEWYRGFASIGNGSFGTSLGSTDVVWVRDSFVSANVPTYFRIVPSAGDDVDMFLYDSTPTSLLSQYEARNDADRTSAGNGAGQHELFNYTTTTSDDVGIVVTNETGGALSWTLYRDTSAPGGSVVINGGAATTTSSNVSLALSASDAQTGIDMMRVCPDGVCNTETWVPYSTSQNVTLPAGTGVRTVQVQYRNRAYMVRTVSDSITVVAPMCNGLPVTHLGNNLNNVLNGTAGDDVFLALGGNDTINGNGGNDTVCAGDGDDIVRLGAGDDWVDGGSGGDDIRTFGGADYIDAGSGNDTVRSGSGPDEVRAGSGADNVIAGNGPDQIYGDGDVDSLNGGAGEDFVDGGTGNDIVRGQGSDDVLEGDIGDDTIRGHAGDDTLRGAGGDDTLLASNGDDDLFGGPDDDTLWAGSGADFANGGTGLNDFCHGGTDNDIDTHTGCEILNKFP